MNTFLWISQEIVTRTELRMSMQHYYITDVQQTLNLQDLKK